VYARPHPWKPDAALLAFSAAILLAAVILEPSTEQTSLFGHAIPSTCVSRNLFGVPCPGCGMTRSFTFLAHGNLFESIRMNPMGPVLFLFLATQVPYRALRVWRAVTQPTVPEGNGSRSG
jgi:hypothetical protein